jgi:uncharacterized delta-60 repeat protein
LLAGPLRPVRQSGGKVLVAAQPDADHSLANQLILARFTRAGALDRSFGRRGRLQLTFPWQFRPLKVFAQQDGGIVLVGTVGGYAYFAGGPSQLGIVRLLPDGARDRSFGTNGFVVWNPPWRAAGEWTFPGLALRQSEGRLLVAATVEDPRQRGSPDASGQRVVLVRFQADGALDQSFGPGGFAELDWDNSSYFGLWARLADGRLASVVFRHEGPGLPTRESTAWWLHTFTADGSPPAALRSTGSVRLGLNVLDQLVDLVPTRDGGLLMIGDAATALRRIRPDGSLDAAYGRQCAQPALPAVSRGGAATRDGGVLVAALTRAAGRTVSLLIPRGPRGCVAATPLRIRGLSVGPPLLLPGRGALVAATYDSGVGYDNSLAVIKIRR